MAGGSWDPTSSKERPGLYINFQNAALALIQGGARGIVGLPLSPPYGTATAKKFYTVTNETEAANAFGSANITAIKRILKGGAQQVLVYTMPTYNAGTDAQDRIDMRKAFDTRPFNVFVYPTEITSTEQDNTNNWMKANKLEGKQFNVVYGGSLADDQVPATGNARTTRLADDFAVNLITGVIENGVTISSAEYACYIAGLIAGTAINKSITYAQAPVDDVSKRLTNAEIVAALQAGSLVLIHDGEKVKVERGITTTKKKIRKVRAEIAISNDLTKTANDNYIGKIDNNADGQKALISAIKAYLETLAQANVLTDEISVALSTQKASVGDEVYLDINVTEVDSMEEIYLTITTG